MAHLKKNYWEVGQWVTSDTIDPRFNSQLTFWKWKFFCHISSKYKTILTIKHFKTYII